MTEREPYSFGDYQQRIHEALRDMVEQANADMGAEVIHPDTYRLFVLVDGGDFNTVMEREVGFTYP